jgi:transposase
MNHYVGIDMSLEDSTLCVVDGNGKIIREGKVASEPEDLVTWFRALKLDLARIGLEAGPLSRWLHARQAGFSLSSFQSTNITRLMSPPSSMIARCSGTIRYSYDFACILVPARLPS